jgi:hypothetical protein
MTTKKPKADQGRPTEQTPCGLLFTDTEAFARYVEFRRIRDWLKSFLDDMEHLRIDAPTAIKRIDAFCDTLASANKTDILARIRASLSGNAEIRLGQQLTALRLHTSNHWDYVVSCVGQDCERPLTGQERPYDGPVPRKSGDQTPAFGYHRALASGRY